MKIRRLMSCTATIVVLSLPALSAAATDYPAPREGDWVARDFRFHTGEVMPELRLHYTTVGEPSGEPVLILHGTAGSGAGMLTADFAGELFGPGQVLDASKYYIILPDAIGAGKSLKPSDGLRAKFPRYNYDDMVAAQHGLVSEGLGIRHLRLVLGNSMGGDADLGVGRDLSRFHGCAGADGIAADRNVEPQLDDAAHADRRDPQRSGLG
ncbi:MAG TPA: alpha/beta fold hydrolase [Stellaceae bacterium]|jgi:homoserine O-acetyltransferase|nr:alpha/beta fold hydrolase [Stellaceae bacterium]